MVGVQMLKGDRRVLRGAQNKERNRAERSFQTVTIGQSSKCKGATSPSGAHNRYRYLRILLWCTFSPSPILSTCVYCHIHVYTAKYKFRHVYFHK